MLYIFRLGRCRHTFVVIVVVASSCLNSTWSHISMRAYKDISIYKLIFFCLCCVNRFVAMRRIFICCTCVFYSFVEKPSIHTNFLLWPVHKMYIDSFIFSKSHFVENVADSIHISKCVLFFVFRFTFVRAFLSELKEKKKSNIYSIHKVYSSRLYQQHSINFHLVKIPNIEDENEIEHLSPIHLDEFDMMQNSQYPFNSVFVPKAEANAFHFCFRLESYTIHTREWTLSHVSLQKKRANNLRASSELEVEME